MPSVLVFNFYLSGNLRGWPDGTTKCRPSSSSIPTCRATLENDRTGRQAAVRPGPGLGRTDCPVENTALDSALEFFYTRDYVLPAEPGEEDEADDQPLLHCTRPAAHLSRSPLMYATMAGAIGVWGKPAPVFEKADNTSTYTSEYFPEQKDPEKEAVKMDGNNDSSESSSSSKLKLPSGLLSSPPLT